MGKYKQLHYEATVPADYAGWRLDQALAALFPEHSRSRLQQWIKQQQVKINSKPCRPRDRLQGGEHLLLEGQQEEQVTAWQAQASFTLPIVAEDEAIIVLNKPAGIVVHPAAGNQENTLANALLHYLPNLAQIPRAGIVHRLDKNTSGLLVVAKTLTAHTSLVMQLQAREVHREYYALVNGVLTAGGTINQPIGRHPVQRQKMAVVVAGGKSAVTHYRIIERFRAHTLLKVLLETGRTHQIRVHLAHRGYPLAGDSTYGARPILPHSASPMLIAALQQYKHQALHARRLSFVHPLTKEIVAFEAPVPENLQQLIQLLHDNMLYI